MLRRLILAIAVVLIVASPVYAADIANTATPMITTGIMNFEITKINDNDLHFTWNYGSQVDRIMIRGAIGRYPSDISDNSTTPSDGWLVYYGNDVAADDMNVILTQDFINYYYKAWGQHPDDTWEIITHKATQENTGLTGLTESVLTFNGTLSQLGGGTILLAILVTFNALAFWQRHVFLYIMVAIINIVYGLYMAAAATINSANWVVGIMIAVLGLFCLFRAAMKMFERE